MFQKKPKESSSHFLKRVRLFAQLLLLSVACNVFLLVYFLSPSRSFEQRQIERIEQRKNLRSQALDLHASLEEAFTELFEKRFGQLVEDLARKELIFDGYFYRDIALTVLVERYYFDLERALLRPLANRVFHFEDKQIKLYPGLDDVDYQKIEDFLRLERWPISSKGVFYLLKKYGLKKDASLLDAFFLSREYRSIYELLLQQKQQLSKKFLAKLLLQGEWEDLQVFVDEQELAQDLSIDRARKFAIYYLEKGSPLAAYWLLEEDLAFASHKLEDANVSLIMDIAIEHPLFANFLQELANSYRSEEICDKARKLLGVSEPQKTPKEQEDLQDYLVQEGDSLWKIAKAYRCDVESIKLLNNLQSDVLRPGTFLKIPLP